MQYESILTSRSITSRIRLGALVLLSAFAGLTLFFTLTNCEGPREEGDLISLQGDGTEENGVLVEGQKDGSFQNYQAFRQAATDISIGNFTGPPGEVIAFTEGHLPTLKTPVQWTPGSDKESLSFDKEYLMHVTVWIVYGSFDKTDPPSGIYMSQQQRAFEACQESLRIWSKERQGLALICDIKDATSNQSATNFTRFDCIVNGDDIKTQIGFDKGVINVYYVGQVKAYSFYSEVYGIWCSSSGLIAMGWDTSVHVLAHELGHALSLQHIDLWSEELSYEFGWEPLFDRTNVMHGASNDRQFLTEGQTFRAIFNDSSIISALYQARPGSVSRDCGTMPDKENQECPTIEKRIWDDGKWPPN